MPNVNGIDLVNRLRNRDIVAPVILITGYPDDSIAAKAAIVGVRDVLLKPHLEESLVARIRVSFGKPAPLPTFEYPWVPPLNYLGTSP